MFRNLDQKSTGIIAGILSALFVCAYVTINKFIYTHYNISAFDYSILFALTGGFWSVLSFAKQANKSNILLVKNNIGSLTLLSIIGSLAVGIFVFGQQYTTSVNASLLVTSTIATTSLFSYIILGDHLKRTQWIWVAILFIGLYIGIVGFHSFTLRSGDLIILGSVLFFGFGNVFSRKLMKQVENPGIVPDTRLVIGGFFAAVLALFVIRDYSLIIAVLPIALLSGLFYWLCVKTFAKSVHLLSANEAIIINNGQIFFTSLTGVIILSEIYTLEKFLGSIIAIVSIYFITTKNN